MTDFNKIKRALVQGGKIESIDFFCYEWESSKSISLFKSVLTSHLGDREEVEIEYVFDIDGELIEIT